MDNDTRGNRGVPLAAARCILAILPDDGVDHRVIKALRLEHGITRVDTVPVRAVAALQNAEAKAGRLPEPMLARLMTAIVPADRADVLLDFIRAKAEIDRPGGGMVLMGRPLEATPFELPADVPDEDEWQQG
jgi:hypothetical protein